MFCVRMVKFHRKYNIGWMGEKVKEIACGAD
jgi:hypothetical protein